ncbi:MAG: hypothetical protein PVF17_00750 [Ignavibacteria bacterium]|jgi:hypothetical protein
MGSKTTIRKEYTKKILSEIDSFPYTSPYMLEGISVNSTGSVAISITLNTKPDSITIPIPAGETYEGDFSEFNIINVTSGDTFYIELRGV